MSQPSFSTSMFLEKYYPRLALRSNSYKTLFETLELKLNFFKSYLIVETGTSRQPNNFEGDGQSTLMFDAFVNYYRGKVYSVDISQENCEIARKQVSNKTEVVCEDSLKFLKTFKNLSNIDLLYLDSYDVDFDKPHNSAMHHLEELAIVYSGLKIGCIIMVDDNKNGVGKGIYVNDFLTKLNCKKIIDDYQIAFIKD